MPKDAIRGSALIRHPSYLLSFAANFSACYDALLNKSRLFLG
jgi:hypothetical protein